MTSPLTPQPDHPMKPTPTAETMSTQLFGVLYIALTGLVDSIVPNSGPCTNPMVALPTGPAVPQPESPNASTYAWLPDRYANTNLSSMVWLEIEELEASQSGENRIDDHQPPEDFGMDVAPPKANCKVDQHVVQRDLPAIDRVECGEQEEARNQCLKS
ncbi:hypothetical protein DSO57_1025085 [Entomophthora muscae]|uniref:Uncharacterized protein n=1 Tax=Entomophthora muscae TaxID=34485 RepID=A0ACC2U1V4_9FUNG|nr:hypothetical protein DSO57_1025085 [Entomophthora muscae]